jgi:hypothetical protein
VIGWFEEGEPDEPTIEVRLVERDGDVVRDEVFVHVLREKARAVECPVQGCAVHRGSPSSMVAPEDWVVRRLGAPVVLTWPNARGAGSTRDHAIAGRNRTMTKFGRTCFASNVPGIKATVCMDITDESKLGCVAIAAGKPVYARATTAAKVGVTTERVTGTQLARLGDLLAVRVKAGRASHFVYVQRKDARAVRCVRSTTSFMARPESRPLSAALLPDGSDAGYRVEPPMDGSSDVVTAGGLTLQCFDDSRVSGLRLRVCTRQPAR